MKKTKSNLGYVNLLNFGEIIKFAKYFDIVELEQPQIAVLSHIRNLVCHADRPLIEKHEDLKNLDEAGRTCISLLEKVCSQ